MKHRVTRVVGAAALLALWPRADLLAQPDLLQDRLKAAFVSKFAQFVEWPPSALNGRPTLELCVSGPEQISTDLRDLVQGESVNGLTLTVRRVERPADIEGCHVLFFSARGEPALRASLARVEQLPILTVGDDPRFLDDGGIVRLRLAGGRVRFDVNAGAAQRSGLRISSQLLQLAENVRGGGA
jgi:hypothetical protein